MLFPPLGLVLLWRGPHRLGRKILGSVGIALYSMPYAALIIYLLASGYLVILTGDGALALVRATPERHEELARFPAIHGKTWNHPAIGEGKLLVRNAVEMACFQIGQRASKP